MDLVRPEVSWPALRSGAVPLGEKRLLRAPRFAPTDAVSHRCVRRRHRLTIESNHLSQPLGDPGPSDQQRRPAPSECRTSDSAHAVADTRGSRGTRPTASRPTFAPRDLARARSVVDSRNIHSRGCRVAQCRHEFALSSRLLPTRPSRLENSQDSESEYTPRSHVSSLLCNTERTPSSLPMARGIAFSRRSPGSDSPADYRQRCDRREYTTLLRLALAHGDSACQSS